MDRLEIGHLLPNPTGRGHQQDTTPLKDKA